MPVGIIGKDNQPPVPLPPRLLAHLRRWVAKGVVDEYFVEWNGRPVKSVKTAFKTALRLAKVSGRISPHTLRHTAVTWLMQNGVDKWEVAGFLGMSALPPKADIRDVCTPRRRRASKWNGNS